MVKSNCYIFFQKHNIYYRNVIQYENYSIRKVFLSITANRSTCCPGQGQQHKHLMQVICQENSGEL